jgi:hypothetical protein
MEAYKSRTDFMNQSTIHLHFQKKHSSFFHLPSAEFQIKNNQKKLFQKKKIKFSSKDKKL